MDNRVSKVVGGIVAVLMLCACALIVVAGAIIYRAYQGIPSDLPSLITPNTDSATAAPTPQLNRTPTDSTTLGTLETLQNTLVPEADPYDLACRLRSLCNIPTTVQAKTYAVGDAEKFWILNSDTISYNQIDATLLYITPHTYFWAQNGVDVDKGDMQALMDTFENEIYPKDREFFGSEWIPGVDNDPHIYVVYAGGLGSHVGGMFVSSNEYNPLIEEHSNAHEIYVLSSNADLSNPYTYGTLAHEFVHMIQYPTDNNESAWMTEGFAEVGAFVNGYDINGKDWLYLQNPDLQLNSWVDNSSPDFGPHYGQSFLYLAYFLDRFGEEATKALTSNPEDDLTSVDGTLAQMNLTDPQSGELIAADDVFMDWAATMYLQDGSIGDGRYTYHNYPEAPRYEPVEESISNCQQTIQGDVNQYGIDYLTIDCPGDHTLQFSGSTVADLLAADAHSGKYAFWSNKGNESDMTLTREFDFTNTNSPIQLSYWTWYDIEKDWDYVHLAASTDGQTWELLTTPSGTDYDPSGASYGWSYTGQSNGWIQEEIDLSKFAGQKVELRFEYITDALLNGDGFFLDDVSIDAINYQSDFESDDGGWQASGFVRIENVLPQTYGVSLIIKGDTTTVTRISLNGDQTASIPFSLKNGEEAALIVTGTTRFTSHPAAYQVEIK